MRVKRGVTKRKAHKKILKAVKGYRMKRSKLISVAYEAYHHAGQYAIQGRRKKKTQMRELWIQRINAALGEDMSYSKFINALKSKNIQLDRRVLADLAISEPKAFETVVKSVK